MFKLAKIQIFEYSSDLLQIGDSYMLLTWQSTTPENHRLKFKSVIRLNSLILGAEKLHFFTAKCNFWGTNKKISSSEVACIGAL